MEHSWDGGESNPRFHDASNGEEEMEYPDEYERRSHLYIHMAEV